MARFYHKNTEKRIAKLRKEGRGSGIGAEYVPWIKVADFSSRGRVHRRHSHKIGRAVHLLSDIEEDVFLKFEADDAVIDIREQFPIPRSETMAIADRLGFRHPKAHGVFTVMTTDMLVDFRGGRRLAVSVKSGTDLDHARTLEKLEIEREYWTAKGVEWVLMLESAVSKAERLNNQEVAEWASLEYLDDAADYDDKGLDLLVDLVSCEPWEKLIDVLKGSEAARDWPAGTGMSVLKRLQAIGRLKRASEERLDVFGTTDQLVVVGD